MADYYHKLQKQIANLLQGVDLTQPPWPEFLQSVNNTYRQDEFELRTLEQSLTLSAEELLMANEEMHAVFQAIPDQLFHINKDNRIVIYKSGNNDTHYLTSNKLINKSIEDVTSRDVSVRFLQGLEKLREDKKPVSFEFTLIHERRVFYYEVRMMPVKGTQAIALVRDITERKLAEEQIAYLAYHDSLTGLPNTRLFKDRLLQGIEQAKRNDKMMAVLFLDLDRFKLINDTMGHDVGDQLLQVISERLMEAVRRTDSIAMNTISAMSSSVARLGGDEFTIMLEDISGTQTVSRICERLIELVSRPLELRGQEVYTSVSIGIAIYPHDGDSVDVLLKNADVAMYHAKEHGRNNYQFFTESMNQASEERFQLENSMRKALQNNEMKLYYQPQVSVASGQIVGMEALIRWQHPEKGFISPASFIPIAEESGLIVQIGEWVIQEACRQSAKWRKSGFKPVRISVNVSAKQLQEESLVDTIKQNFETYGVDANTLGIELTETAIIVEPELALTRLEMIKQLGIKLSMDDFGTGYSSLSYLKRFPIDTLKIDQSFIRSVTVDNEDGALVKAIIAMAHALGMDVVAEGVELQEQLEFLGVHGCDTMQGYLFSRPVPSAELEKLLSK